VVGGKRFDGDISPHPRDVKGVIEQSEVYPHEVLPAMDAL